MSRITGMSHRSLTLPGIFVTKLLEAQDKTVISYFLNSMSFSSLQNSQLKEFKNELNMVAHSVTPALGRLRQGNHEFKGSLGYIAR
jgi:hypothetical protein